MDTKRPLAYIVGAFDPWTAHLFRAQGFEGTRDLTIADVAIFTGGEDVNPALYYEMPIKETFTNIERDKAEVVVYNSAREFGIPMVGICRGGQFLNVMNGGRMWQHVHDHGVSHYLIDKRTNERTLVTSTHHQMMRPTHQASIIAVAAPPIGTKGKSLCRVKYSDMITQYSTPDEEDPEVLWYEDAQCLCFQPHPEIPTAASTRAYFWNIFDEFITPIIENNAQGSATACVD